MKTKPIFLFVALTLATTLFASDIQVDGIWYNFDNTNLTASVTYKGNSYYEYENEYTGSVVIPVSVSYNNKTYSVTAIGNYAFENCSSLTSVTIPNSVTTIGNNTFLGCRGLISVTIPNSVITIGDGAFYGCRGLTSVTINSNAIASKKYAYNDNFSNIFGSQVTQYILGNSVTTIGDRAFYGCTGLTSLTIGNSVITIGDDAFFGCTGLTSLTIGNSVITIGDDAFFGCSSLTSVTIGNSVTTIGEYAFSGCSGLTGALTIPNSVTTIGVHAFDGCSSLASVTIGNSVTTIGRYTFSSCSRLKTVTIPNSVTTIEERVFYNCSSLASVTIGNSVTTIGRYAFSGCSLESVTINSNAIASKEYTKDDNFSTIFGSRVTQYILGDSVTAIGNYAFYNCSSLTGALTIPNSVTTIGDWAFYGCTGLSSVIIGNSVTTIGKFAFDGCTGLTGALTIPNSVTTVEEHAFYKCSGLTSVTIGNSVTTIGEYAFYGCSGLTGALTIPNSVTTIEEHAFYKCSGLTSVTIGNSVTTIGGNAFEDCSGLTSVTIGNSVTTIGESAFEDCSGLTSVTINSNAICNKTYTYSSNIGSIFGSQVQEYIIGDSVTTIGNDAFSGCRGLTSVTIPNSVTTIGEGAFENCSSLTSVTIPNSVITIGNDAFSGCRGLTSVTIPNSVTTIGNYAFYHVNNIVYNGTATGSPWGAKCVNGYIDGYLVYSDATKTKLCGCFTNATGEISIPNSVTTIGNYAFNGCSGLTSITIPKSVTTIGDGTFCDCSGLTSVTIPNSVTTIGNFAFENCSGLTSVTIPNSVTTIGIFAFYGCSGLTSVTIPNSVTTIGNSAFLSCSSLTSVTIPNSVTTIGNYAFEGCSGLAFITIPNSVTTIGYEAFLGCSGLTSVTIGNSVTTIGERAFYGCSGLTSITCYATTPPSCGNYCFKDVPQSIPVYVLARSLHAYEHANVWKDFYNLQENPNDYWTVTCIAKNGKVDGGGEYIKGDACILTVIPDFGYNFIGWTDGNTDNPRSVVVTQDTIFEALCELARFGTCGDNLMWNYNDGILVVSGTGAMYDYTQGTASWTLFKDSISSLVINNGCTSIGNYAFYGLSNKNFKTIDIPNGVEQIGQFAFANCEYIKNVYLGLSLEKISANAFANDERLLYITCYAIEPPLLDESAFVNYDAYLSVPCESQDEYKVSKGWKLFNKENVSCIGAEEKPITGDEVTVDPSADNATFTWPQNDQAAGYSIEITKDGIVFCTLTFNAQGQLTGIAFAPNRAGSRMLDAAVMTATGWQFTVTGLDQASKYGYALDALNASKQSIKHYEGEFATDGYTSLEWVTSDHIQGINKMLLDGHLYILRDGNLYNATGARVK